MLIILLALAGIFFAQPAAAQQSVNFNTAIVGWDWTRTTGGPMDNFVVSCKNAVSGVAAIPITTATKQIAVLAIVQSLAVPVGTSVRCTVVALNAGVPSDPSNELVLVNTVLPPPPPPPAAKPDAPTNFRVITP